MLNLVTVIIAAYNAQDTLTAAVESALMQKNCVVEIIIVDDCSTDNTREVAQELASENHNIRVIKTPENLGPSGARNLALDSASGQWIAILDADDRFCQDRISRLLNAAIGANLDFVADSYLTARSVNHPPHAARMTDVCSKHTLLRYKAADFIRLGLGSLKPLIRKQFLDQYELRYDPEHWAGEDLLLYTTMLLHRARFGFLNRPMYIRTEEEGSLSRANKVAFLQSLLQVQEQIRLLTKTLSPADQSVIQAIKQRKSITQDALATAKWKQWLGDANPFSVPPLRSIFRVFRHLRNRQQRFHITQL